ncbi:MAG: hypothetical protein OXS29_01110 [bacterium]|nr:hypothetical protein [bacterium]MDE0288226.1 hypothetical protein [bacterium]MDE0439990.1 hypothetical protein [bacterium]
MSAEAGARHGLERSEVERYIAERPPVELQMARSIVSRAVVVGPVMLLAFGLARGRDGLVAAAIGVAIVTGYYLLTGSMLSWLARVSLGAYHAGALLGFILRLGLIAATMWAVISLFEVDRTALGLAVIATYVGLLLWEAATLGRNKGRRVRSRG